MGMRFEHDTENLSDVIADAVATAKARVERAQATVNEVHETYAGGDPAAVLAALQGDPELREVAGGDEQLETLATQIAAGERPILR
jgi:hypothetical protein